MTRENAILCLKGIKNYGRDTFTEQSDWQESLDMAIKALEREPCEDAISRQAVLAIAGDPCLDLDSYEDTKEFCDAIKELPPVTPQPKMGRCKDCKYFEYDSVAKVDGMPLIVAHEICSKWGGGCKTKEDGFCFMFEPQERNDKE